jgi:hypothetical protein
MTLIVDDGRQDRAVAKRGNSRSHNRESGRIKYFLIYITRNYSRALKRGHTSVYPESESEFPQVLFSKGLPATKQAPVYRYLW